MIEGKAARMNVMPWVSIIKGFIFIYLSVFITKIEFNIHHFPDPLFVLGFELFGG
jgi:hypothetical protein